MPAPPGQVARGSLDALVGRLRAFEEHDFTSTYEVRDSQDTAFLSGTAF
jgi:hypothetical protein